MNFQYKVKNAQGQIVTGLREAPNRSSLMRELRDEGSMPLIVMPAGSSPRRAEGSAAGVSGAGDASGKVPFWQRSIGRAVKEQEVIMFTRDVLSLVHAGIPLVGGLRDISIQIKNIHLRAALDQVVSDIEGGTKMSDAFGRYPQIFSEFFCNSIRAGEESGRLEMILERLVEAMEHDLETRMAVKDAVRYPLIVLGFLGVAFTLMVTMVVPRIARMFAKFDTTLPLPTRVIIGIGDFFQHYGLFVLIGAVVSAVVIGFWKKTPDGRLVWDSLKLKIPVFGELFRKLSCARFAGTLQTLYASGIVLPQGLEVASRVVDNALIAKTLRQSSHDVMEGRPVSESLAESGLFPPLVVRMVGTGEKTGNLEQMLGEIKTHYEREIRYMTKMMTTLIEPILTVCLGLMILVFALGVFLPMWNIMKLFRGAGS